MKQSRTENRGWYPLFKIFHFIYQAIPQVPRDWAFVCFLLNTWVAFGLGTLLATGMDSQANISQLWIAYAQLYFGSWFGIGGVWSIVWGILLFIKGN